MILPTHLPARLGTVSLGGLNHLLPFIDEGGSVTPLHVVCAAVLCMHPHARRCCTMTDGTASGRQAAQPSSCRQEVLIVQPPRRTYTRRLPLHGPCVRPRIGALGTARPSRAAAARVQVHTAAHLHRTTCKWLGRFQGLQPQRPLAVVSPARWPRSFAVPRAASCSMAQLVVTSARMQVPGVRWGRVGWAGGWVAAGRTRLQLPPLRMPCPVHSNLQPALRRARVFWDLGEKQHSLQQLGCCWSGCHLHCRSVPVLRCCGRRPCRSQAPRLSPPPISQAT